MQDYVALMISIGDVMIVEHFIKLVIEASTEDDANTNDPGLPRTGGH